MLLPLDSLLQFSPHRGQSAALFIGLHRKPGRLAIEDAATPEHPLSARTGLWAQKRGEAPYHPLYLAAILMGAGHEYKELDPGAIGLTPIPAISFDTDAAIRTSMTLNGMRMATEFAASGSNRLFDLVDNRLELGQSDVVHDILVYAMRQILDARREMLDAAALRAENVAAYLGLHPQCVLAVLAPQMGRGTTVAIPSQLASALGAAEAGAISRDIDIGATVRAQWIQLLGELRPLRHREATAQVMLEAIVAALYQASA